MDDVDLALILAFDGSASVSYDEFGLIAGGCAAALRDPAVVAGLLGGPLRSSLCALLLWSGSGAQAVLVDWTRLGAKADLAAFADAVDNVPRIVRAGSTAIGEALIACEKLLALAPAAARRRVIDVAGDGRSNEGDPPGPVRDRLAAAGVTINGLCVLHEEPDLLASYTREVIGGLGAFALQCQDYSGFADAMRQKLQQEIS
ncbi:MAG: DUF1194 domain-containing protein [Rhodospirillales bacterium]|nr:DUF1194 domain-containing protein [Rhodospirillales bacterium]MDE2576192.1 DUF1194 domain-containing protein [Rhodospirillales bacterium]